MGHPGICIVAAVVTGVLVACCAISCTSNNACAAPRLYASVVMFVSGLFSIAELGWVPDVTATFVTLILGYCSAWPQCVLNGVCLLSIWKVKSHYTDAAHPLHDEDNTS